MDRRTFMGGLAGGLLALPFTSGAQQAARVPRIGVLYPGKMGTGTVAMRQGLQELGYVEGRTAVIEWRWWEGKPERLRDAVAEMVRLNLDVIVVGGSEATQAMKEATRSIPIVFSGPSYPVEEGLVTSVNRPGGNASGVNLLASELLPKRLELLVDLLPQTSRYAAILNPKTPSAKYERPDLERARQQMGLPLLILEASTESDLKKVFEVAAKEGIEALVVSNDGFFTSRRTQIIQLAAQHKLPAIYGTREFAVAGGLMSYGPNIGDAYRQVGEYVGRVLMGAKPADMPVQQPTRFDLAINLKTAKALGIEVPPTLLARADEVIE